MINKKRHKYIFLILSTTFMLLFLSCTVYADQQNIYDIDTSQLDELMNDYMGDRQNNLSATDAAQNIELNDFFGIILTTVKDALSPSIKTLFSLIITVVLISVIKNTNHALDSREYSKITYLITTLALTIVCYDLISTTKEITNTFVKSTCTLINILLPVMTSLYTLGGNISTAVVNSTGLTFLLTIISILFQNMLYPLINISFGLTIAGCASNQGGIKQINKTIKSFFSFILTSLITILSIFLLFKSNLSQAADNATSRSIKFAGSFIPVIGGALGESVRSVMSGLNLIKDSVGMVGLFIIFAITIPVLSNLITKKICIEITAATAAILECNDECNLLKGISGILNLAIALVSAISLLFILELVIFVSISPALGGNQ